MSSTEKDLRKLKERYKEDVARLMKARDDLTAAKQRLRPFEEAFDYAFSRECNTRCLIGCAEFAIWQRSQTTKRRRKVPHAR